MTEPYEVRHLTREAARALATTTKTIVQTTDITPRWVLKLLPWVQVAGGTYRVNRRKLVVKPRTRVEVVESDGTFAVASPRELAKFRLFEGLDEAALSSLVGMMQPESFAAGQTICDQGTEGDKFFLIVSGRTEIFTKGPHGEHLRMAMLYEGQYFGEIALLQGVARTATVVAATDCRLLSMDRAQFDKMLTDLPATRLVLSAAADGRRLATSAANQHGEAAIDLASNHHVNTVLPETFADYEEDPREYSLSMVQTVLTMSTYISDVYNDPIDQLREQIRLTAEAIRERQEFEVVNSPEFGLLHSVSDSMVVLPRGLGPTPDDMDELLAKVWKDPAFFLAHPRAIAAFGRECTRRGVPPPTVQINGAPFLTWRGVPLIPTDKLMVGRSMHPQGEDNRSDILLMRVGESKQGVVGLHKTNLPGEYSPGLSVRHMGIGRDAVANYLMTAYFSAAVLTEDAIGLLRGVEVGSYHDGR